MSNRNQNLETVLLAYNQARRKPNFGNRSGYKNQYTALLNAINRALKTNSVSPAAAANAAAQQARTAANRANAANNRGNNLAATMHAQTAANAAQLAANAAKLTPTPRDRKSVV